jgi:hypothetical protein
VHTVSNGVARILYSTQRAHGNAPHVGIARSTRIFSRLGCWNTATESECVCARWPDSGRRGQKEKMGGDKGAKTFQAMFGNTVF